MTPALLAAPAARNPAGETSRGETSRGETSRGETSRGERQRSRAQTPRVERPQEKGRTRRAVCVAGGTGATLALLGACGAPGGATTPAVQPGTRAAELRLHVRAGSEADTLDQRLPELTKSTPG